MFVGRTASLTPMLTLSGVLDYLKMYRPYLTLAIPSFYSYMLNAPEFENADLSFLKYAISGGDKLDTVEKERINAFFRRHGSACRINDGSGNGEGCGALTNTAALFRKYNYTSIGHGEQHLAHILHLLVFLAGILHPGQLGHALHQIGHGGAEFFGNVVVAQGGILDNVVQQGRHDGILVQTHLLGDFRRRHAVGHIG